MRIAILRRLLPGLLLLAAACGEAPPTGDARPTRSQVNDYLRVSGALDSIQAYDLALIDELEHMFVMPAATLAQIEARSTDRRMALTDMLAARLQRTFTAGEIALMADMYGDPMVRATLDKGARMNAELGQERAQWWADYVNDLIRTYELEPAAQAGHEDDH